jgi:hypothetical protein
VPTPTDSSRQKGGAEAHRLRDASPLEDKNVSLKVRRSIPGLNPAGRMTRDRSTSRAWARG